jgi:hypothetical protein
MNMRMKLAIVLVVLFAIAITIAFVAISRPFEEKALPPEILPDGLLVNNTRSVTEVKAFTARYEVSQGPFVDRSSGRIIVFYRAFESAQPGDAKDINNTSGWVELAIRMNNQAQPVAMQIHCVPYDIDGYKVTKDIVKYLQNEDCFTSRPAPEPYAEPL